MNFEAIAVYRKQKTDGRTPILYQVQPLTQLCDFAQYFGMSADFWMNLQRTYELDLARRTPKRSETAETRPEV